tara:strand:+ start:20393 stop:20668 length:276 start_codon:yes stop_codon:yes gene_type:complete
MRSVEVKFAARRPAQFSDTSNTFTVYRKWNEGRDQLEAKTEFSYKPNASQGKIRFELESYIEHLDSLHPDCVYAVSSTDISWTSFDALFTY